MRHRLPHFQHLFSGSGYAAGYYSYMWSEVLDADAFEAFEETGNAFDPETAQRLRDYIYSAGNLRDPAEAYKAFRGRLPTVDALLEEARARPMAVSGMNSPHRRPSPRRRLRAACRRGRGRPRHPRRGRQRHRGDAGDGGVDRGGLSAHEPCRRRRLLADPRALGPRARADGGGTRRRQSDAAALSRCRPPRNPGARAARRAHRAGRGGGLDARERSGEGASWQRNWRQAAARRAAGARHQTRARGLHGDAQPGAADGGKTAGDEGRRRLQGRLPARRQGAGGGRAAQADAPSPPRSSISRTPASTISIAAMSAARSPPIWSASAVR